MGNLKNKISENQLVTTLIEHFKEKNVDIYLEVPFLSRNIDIVLANKSNNETFAIEAKISWWERAIDQAKLTLLGVDKAYVAMPASRMKSLKRYKKTLISYGIGVLSVGYYGNKSSIEEIMPASRSNYKSIPRKNELVKVIKDGLYLTPEDLLSRA